MPQVHAIVLAAGLSARYGSHKLLLPAGEGHTVVSRTVASALAGTDGRVVVVLGREAQRVRAAVTGTVATASAPRLRFVTNSRYEQGLGTSVSAGIGALAGTLGNAIEVDGRVSEAGVSEAGVSVADGAETEVIEAGGAETEGVEADGVRQASAGSDDGALIMLGDQPLVSAQQISELASAFLTRSRGTVAVAAASRGKRRNPVVIARELFPELLELSDDEGARRVLQRRREQVVLVEFGPGAWCHDIDTPDDYLRLAGEAGWEVE